MVVATKNHPLGGNPNEDGRMNSVSSQKVQFYYEVTKNTKDWLKICLFVVDICRGQHQLSAFSTLRIGVTGYSRGFSANQTV